MCTVDPCLPGQPQSRVSIPFKRESTCAQRVEKFRLKTLQSFNSLQTGKHMCTAIGQGFEKLLEAFQFPSNGKAHVHEVEEAAEEEEEEVSIPFKRESTCARKLRRTPCFAACVSIPFKRESTCARRQMKRPPSQVSCFNSLQTGKHMCTKQKNLTTLTTKKVSIPFKRESTCAHESRTWV